MILGVGIDLVEIQRIALAINNPRFVARVFTAGEQAYCDSRKAQRASSYAARFAAKEAVMKALGTGLSKGQWQDIEVVSSPEGKPRISLDGFFAEVAGEIGVRDIHVSLTHCRDYAGAHVVLEGGGNCEGSNCR